MTDPFRFDDETVAAYVDGELDPTTRALVETAAAGDAGLAARLAAQRDLKAMLTGHYAPVAEEPVPERLLRTIRGGAPAAAEVVDLAARRAGDKAGASRPAFRLSVWAGMAACLVAGVVMGRMVLPASVGVTGAPGQALVASGPLSRALDDQAAADASGPIRIGISFRDREGGYCRTFQPRGGAGLAGLACREADGWRLRVAAPVDAGAEADYRTAAAETPPVVLSAVDAMIDGAPLDAKGEAAALVNGWRRAVVSPGARKVAP